MLGGKMNLDLALEGQVFEPGQAIAARVAVGGSGDDKLRGLRVELGYKNTYYHRTSSGSDGGSNDTKTTDNVVVHAEHLAADDPGMLGGSGSFDFKLWIPEDVPPSAPKWVDWSVTAILDRRRARDRRESVPVTILARATGYGLWASSPQTCDEDVCDMVLDMPSRVACAGETLAGTLRIDPKREFETRRVRVALEGRMHHEDNIERKVGEAKVTIAERTAFAPGFAQEFPFAIAVPPDALPSLLAAHNQVRWTLRGICDRSLRGDHDVSMEIVVHNAR